MWKASARKFPLCSKQTLLALQHAVSQIGAETIQASHSMEVQELCRTEIEPATTRLIIDRGSIHWPENIRGGQQLHRTK